MLSLLATLLAGPALIQAPAPAEHPVVGLDRTLNQLYQKKDAETAGAFLLDPFVLTFATAPGLDRAAFLDRVKNPEVIMTVNETKDPQVHAFGDTAVLLGELHQKGTARGTPFDIRLKVTATWVRVGDTWKELAAHLVPITEVAQTPPQPVPRKK